jgi:Nif-specific regulatory protein
VQLERPEVILDVATSNRRPWTELARLRQASSLMVIPVHSYGPTAYLYLDRLAEGHRSAFGPSHLNLCLALGGQIAGLLERVALERSDEVDDSEEGLGRRIFLADVVTQNPDMIKILKLVEKVSATDLTVLLQGETGTGKTLIARAVHLTSDRKEGPFVTVDCAALPENLLESELFGFIKGAFTGAGADKKGLFEEADGGTIFLDEIGKAGLGVQRRLLHLLDRGEVRPVGSTSYRKLNVRVICATSKKNLLADDESSPFIKDLFYRLNDIIIHVPSLSDRPEDIPLLADYFLETFNQQTGSAIPGFSRAARQRMVRYGWPGNVRELEKAVRRAAILADAGETIGVELLPPEIVASTETPQVSPALRENGLRETVEDMERRMVLDALEQNNWNKTRAAQTLGLSRKGLKNKISRYGLARRGA